jgi:predicted HD superfamily hydrolase involved in NAD metabolism
MDITQAVELVRGELNASRFDHTLRVMETSEVLAERFEAPVEHAKLAAVLHDYAKNWPAVKLRTYIEQKGLSKDLLNYHKELWHGPVAADVMEHKYHIQNADILNAIRYHTTGRAEMKTLEKIIYLADYIEPGRDFPGLEEVRAASEDNLDYACWLVSRNSLSHLLNKSGVIHPDSLGAYNAWTKLIKSEGLLDE